MKFEIMEFEEILILIVLLMLLPSKKPLILDWLFDVFFFIKDILYLNQVLSHWFIALIIVLKDDFTMVFSWKWHNTHDLSCFFFIEKLEPYPNVWDVLSAN